MKRNIFKATESVRGTILWALGTTNRGSLSETGYNRIIAFIAIIGHKGVSPSRGRGIVTISFLFCNVFDYLISRIAPSGVDIFSYISVGLRILEKIFHK